MRLAPLPVLHATLAGVGSGMSGVRQTVRQMRALVNQGRVDPAIRQCATTLIYLAPEKQDRQEVSKLLDFVQRSIRYVRDVNDVETLSSAAKTLAQRLGDCDDQSVLLASLCESVGYPTRFIVASYDDPAIMEHVYCSICVDGDWLDADPTEDHPLGWAPPDPVSILVENV